MEKPAGEALAEPRIDPRSLCRVVLEASRLGVLGPGLVASVLRIPPSRARMVIGALESIGWIRRLQPSGGGGAGCPCARCPLRRVCPLSSGRGAGGGGAELYTVDRGAVEYCRRLLSSGG